MFADKETMAFYPRTKTRAECLAWIEWNLALYEQHGFGLWVMESLGTGEFLGDCGLTPQTVDEVDEIELGWHTKRECWNQGFATEAAIACRDFALDRLGLDRLVSIIDPGNKASIRVAEKIGMRRERETIHNNKAALIYTLGAKGAMG
jgi:RimJ/RimL family protein N-acetyltransferase